MTARIGDDHSDIYAVNADVNCLAWLLRIFLGIGERTRAEHGGKERRPHKTKKVHRSAIQPTGPNGCPSNPSTRRSKSNEGAARRLADRSAGASREPGTARHLSRRSRSLRPGFSSPPRSNDPSVPANRLFESPKSSSYSASPEPSRGPPPWPRQLALSRELQALRAASRSGSPR